MLSPVHRVPAFSDNYIWMFEYSPGLVAVVDPGDATPVLAAAAGQDTSHGAGAPTRGWWIVCAQTGDARAQDVVQRAQALARDAASPGDVAGDIVFRFMSRPALMRQVIGTRAVSPTRSSGSSTIGAALADRVRDDASGALDALDRVETVIRRRRTFNELFDGTISIQMRPEP